MVVALPHRSLPVGMRFPVWRLKTSTLPLASICSSRPVVRHRLHPPFRTKGPNSTSNRSAMPWWYNYGHGGSGWSLSGSRGGGAGASASSPDRASQGSAAASSVWTSAITAQAGRAQHHLYPRDAVYLLVGSQRQLDARITASRWRRKLRATGAVERDGAYASWKTLRLYLGGFPAIRIAFTDQYRLSDTPFGEKQPPDPAIPPCRRCWTGLPTQPDFANYADHRGHHACVQVLADDINPFPALTSRAPPICFSTSPNTAIC